MMLAVESVTPGSRGDVDAVSGGIRAQQTASELSITLNAGSPTTRLWAIDTARLGKLAYGLGTLSSTTVPAPTRPRLEVVLV